MSCIRFATERVVLDEGDKTIHIKLQIVSKDVNNLLFHVTILASSTNGPYDARN